MEREGGIIRGLFSVARIANFFEFEFYSLERILDGVNAVDFLVDTALVDAVLSVLSVLPD